MARSFFTRVQDSLGVKLFTIGFLILVLLIPSAMIHGLINERSSRESDVIREITSKWGSDQVITGPILTIPYRTYTVEKEVYREKGKPAEYRNRKRYSEQKVATFLPEDFQCNGKIDTEMKSRGIYEAILYNSGLHITAKFAKPDFSTFAGNNFEIEWDEAVLTLGISDMKGIAGKLSFEVNGKKYSPESGVISNAVASGVSQKFPLNDSVKEISFSTLLNLNGSGSLNFIPVGKESEVALRSDWQSPSFTGAKLPVHDISDKGFTAQWNVLEFNRAFPQKWESSRSYAFNTNTDYNNYYNQSNSGDDFGVRFIKPADQYQSVERSAKYAVLFILLTFVTLFIVEVTTKKRVHPIQYLLIGFALVLFYTLLLSFSEQWGFSPAYVIASLASISLIGMYIQAILKTVQVSLIVSGLLSTLYAYLFVTLHQEEYALLMGSVGLFLILAAIMFVTRNIDWYGSKEKGGDELIEEIDRYDELC